MTEREVRKLMKAVNTEIEVYENSGGILTLVIKKDSDILGVFGNFENTKGSIIDALEQLKDDSEAYRSWDGVEGITKDDIESWEDELIAFSSGSECCIYIEDFGLNAFHAFGINHEDYENVYLLETTLNPDDSKAFQSVVELLFFCRENRWRLEEGEKWYISSGNDIDGYEKCDELAKVANTEESLDIYWHHEGSRHEGVASFDGFEIKFVSGENNNTFESYSFSDFEDLELVANPFEVWKDLKGLTYEDGKLDVTDIELV